VLKYQMITNIKIVGAAATLLITGAFLAQPALAEGDVEAGKELGYSCLGCHGIEGYRNAYPSYRVPKLGGQHPTMVGQASSLSDQQMEDVAAYLASIGSETVAAGGSENASFDKAQNCTACHGNNGVSVNAMWPTLAGQHEDYLLRALKSYRDGTRKDPVMGMQASLIEEEDLAVLAKYFASLEGLETTKPE
jgi:cytochrome c553